MVQFTRLRLSGFKSFVEPVEFEIGKGLTGIVGPNGCGKSNLVEALRWVMGENSAKRMRSGGMEDVIFNGTERRPPRNMAEVVLSLDNSSRTAPAELNHADELEVSRRIERDSGSAYKVNGKNVRMRDVQILFADNAIGSHSPAMVSQGRVSDMINAKPAQRRMVLEEAAGVSGLHARRHEAELKLRAAEQNLVRVEDVVGAMTAQLETLKKQARQASRYRNLSGHIETAEGGLLYLRWTHSQTAVEQALAAFSAADAVVGERTLAAAALATRQTEAGAALPDLRMEEAEAAAALQRLKLAYGGLESEERQVRDERAKAETLLSQFTADVEHETGQKAEAESQIQSLTSEQYDLAEAARNVSVREEDARSRKDEQHALVEKTETELAALTEQTAAADAERAAVQRRIEGLDRRLAQLTERKAALEAARADITAATPAPETLDALATAVAAAEEAAAGAAAQSDAADATRAAIESSVQDTAETLHTVQKAFSQLSAEAAALSRILKNRQDSFPPVIDSLTVEAGFEKALAVALGDDLQAALDPAAPVSWREMEACVAPPLPSGATPLAQFVKGPPALARILSHIGVAPDAETAERLMPALAPGQGLVTAEGGAWRWDGLVVASTAENAAAIRLQQKNRLTELEGQLVEAEAALTSAQTGAALAKEARAQAAEAATAARQFARQAEESLNAVRKQHASLSSQMAQVAAKLAGLDASINSADTDIAAAGTESAEAQAALSALPDTTDSRARIASDKIFLSEQRQTLAERQAAHAEIRREGEARARRSQQVEADIESWQGRTVRAAGRLDELASRIAQAEDVLTRLSSRPAEIENEKQDLLSHISAADAKRQDAADALALAENTANELARALRAAESALSDAREARALAQGQAGTAQQARESAEAQISEKFQSTPEALATRFELKPEDMPPVSDLQAKLDRLLRERDNMGPVNLLAESEAQEITDKMNAMTTERDDLTAAIGKLREGISKLNREARERLLAAFDAVDGHFQKLFTRLFNGGAAYLKMIDADDPLEAGLEIFAQPPGKKMQSLSLLSGGEQTLTSIALIFAMFLTNPAPICVLDEVDAPLDESNVDRLCTLLEQLAKESTTRFIIVTHHRMTMARMDRLYGVTMSEKGVSQLVSVDLAQHALQLEEAA